MAGKNRPSEGESGKRLISDEARKFAGNPFPRQGCSVCFTANCPGVPSGGWEADALQKRGETRVWRRQGTDQGRTTNRWVICTAQRQPGLGGITAENASASENSANDAAASGFVNHPPTGPRLRLYPQAIYGRAACARASRSSRRSPPKRLKVHPEQLASGSPKVHWPRGSSGLCVGTVGLGETEE